MPRLIGKWEAATKVSKQKASILFVEPSGCLGHNMALAWPHAPSPGSEQRLEAFPQHILASDTCTLQRLPPPSLLFCLSSHSVFPNWTMGRLQLVVGLPGGGWLTKGKWSDGRTITSRWCFQEWSPDKFTVRLSSERGHGRFILWRVIGAWYQALKHTH